MYCGLTIVSVVGIVIKYGVALKFEHFSEPQNYVTLYNLDYTNCVDSCDRRIRCIGVQYSHRRKECHLMEPGLGTLDPKTRKYAVYRKSYEPTGICGNQVCRVNDVCDPGSDSCEIKECDRFDGKGIALVLGNIPAVGSRIATDCKTGLLLPDGGVRTARVCNASGTWEPPDVQCVPATCNLIWSVNNGTGEYYSYDEGTKKVIKIFCDFAGGHGYTYISQKYIADVTDISRYYTRTDHVMVRHYVNDQQFEGKIEILSEYSAQGNITILLNDHGDFYEPSNLDQEGSYIFLQILPANFDLTVGLAQGYRFEGADVRYSVPVMNSKYNYLLIYAGDMRPAAFDQQVSCPNNAYNLLGCRWILAASRVGSSEELPASYFYNYSMHMGGGGIVLHRVLTGGVVTGVIFGFRFDL